MLNPAALLCVGFCCSGTIVSYDAYELIGIQVDSFSVRVTCTDGSSCYGHFEIYRVGSYHEISFSSNC